MTKERQAVIEKLTALELLLAGTDSVSIGDRKLPKRELKTLTTTITKALNLLRAT